MKDPAAPPRTPEGTPPSPTQPTADAASVSPDDALARLQDELAQWKDKAARARADYDNLQKRVTRDAAQERERAKARVLEAFLPLLELSHMAAQQAEMHPGALSEGVRLLAREFDRLARQQGLVPLGAVGEVVDPTVHEVLAQEAADGVGPGCVSRVVQPGYALDGKVLRYAKVCAAPANAATMGV